MSKKAGSTPTDDKEKKTPPADPPEEKKDPPADDSEQEEKAPPAKKEKTFTKAEIDAASKKAVEEAQKKWDAEKDLSELERLKKQNEDLLAAGRVRILQSFAVQMQLYRQALRIGDLVGRSDEFAHRCKSVARFPPLPLPVRKLKIACTDIVEICMSENVIHRIFPSHISGSSADNKRELRLVISLAAGFRNHYRLIGTNDARRKF